jgi:hypothetical protein
MSDRGDVGKEVLKYIRCGMSDSSIRDKFGPAYAGLQQLFNELADAGFMGSAPQDCPTPGKKRINAKEMTADVLAGATRRELMKKYTLTRTELRKALRKLVGAQSVRVSDLSPDLETLYDSAAHGRARREDRYCIDFELPVWEEQTPDTKGQVLDITERGLGTIGIAASVEQVKTLVVFSEEFLEIDPFSFEATCRWAKTEDGTGHHVSGFAITRIRDHDLQELRKLIELLKV